RQHKSIDRHRDGGGQIRFDIKHLSISERSSINLDEYLCVGTSDSIWVPSSPSRRAWTRTPPCAWLSPWIPPRLSSTDPWRRRLAWPERWRPRCAWLAGGAT
ncbi:unnamed protein product, partial [Musa hybrid cultivar]